MNTLRTVISYACIKIFILWDVLIVKNIIHDQYSKSMEEKKKLNYFISFESNKKKKNVKILTTEVFYTI